MHDGGGGGGLFAHYPATPGAIESGGDALTTRARGLDAFGRGLRTAYAPAEAAVDGLLLEPVAAAPRPVQRQSTELARAALVAGGAVIAFGNDVTDFDQGVDRLNQRWRQAAASDFGVAAPSLPPGASRGERDDAATEHAGAVSAARAALLAELQREHGRLEDDLDADARAVAAMLDRGPSDEVALDLLRAGALPATALTLFPGVHLSRADLATMRANLRRYGDLDAWTTPAGATADELRAQLDVLRAMDVAPADYRELLQWFWATTAAEKAGIDLTGWDVTLGADGLRTTIEQVYRYYGDLYLEHPWMQWAGMANMIGPSFAAGFYDLASYRRFAGAIGDIPDWAMGALPPGLRQAGALADLSAADIAFYEQTFLGMQKEIFFDQASMHEAYLDGGTEAIEEMYDAGLLGQGGADADQALLAWQRIDEGLATADDDLLQQGNTDLLFREQRYIIEDQYQDMKDHLPTGPAVTYLMGALGTPSIPGAQSLGDYAPVSVEVDSTPDVFGLPNPIPGPTLSVETPFPAGNIADFDTRWDLVTGDTLPAYQDLLANDPQLAADIVADDVGDRIHQQQMGIPVDELLDFLTSGWDVSVGIG